MAPGWTPSYATWSSLSGCSIAAPAFTVTAVAALALGIGANTAIFSLTEAALFRSAPVYEPQQLVAVWTTCRNGTPRCSSSYPDLLDYRDRSTSLEDLAAYGQMVASLGGRSSARLVSTQLTTGNYFELLGIVPGRGRLLQPADDLLHDPRPVVVLSDRLWRREFGADPDIVGREIELNRALLTVVGVTPPRFEGLHMGEGPDIYVPMFSGPLLGTGFVEDSSRFERRGSRWIAQLVGRMKPGASVEQVRAEMQIISDQLAAEYPQERGPPHDHG